MWFTPVVVKPDETLGKISEFNEAVCPRSSLRRSFSVQEAIVNSVYLSIPPTTSPPPPAIAERKTFCYTLKYTGKLGMADLVLVEITD